METKKTLKRKDIKNEVNCPGWVIDYLNDCGRLPVVRESSGHGHPRLYDISAIDIVKAHVEKRRQK